MYTPTIGQVLPSHTLRSRKQVVDRHLFAKIILILPSMLPIQTTRDNLFRRSLYNRSKLLLVLILTTRHGWTHLDIDHVRAMFNPTLNEISGILQGVTIRFFETRHSQEVPSCSSKHHRPYLHPVPHPTDKFSPNNIPLHLRICPKQQSSLWAHGCTPIHGANLLEPNVGRTPVCQNAR
jgi:hypothetical protein